MNGGFFSRIEIEVGPRRPKIQSKIWISACAAMTKTSHRCVKEFPGQHISGGGLTLRSGFG